MITAFKENSDLRIGQIIEVNGTALRIEIDPKMLDLTRTVDGRVYSIGQIASILKVHFGRKILFAYVRMLRMRSEVALELGDRPISPGDDSRIIEADLFGQGLWNSTDSTLDFSRGVETYPLPMQSVYLVTNDEQEVLYKSAESSASKNGITTNACIGHYVGSSGIECSADIDKLFGQHCAVLGSTGSGKSGTVAAILHAVLEMKSASATTIKPRIIVIDPHGEYKKAFSNQAVVYRAYSRLGADEDDCLELKLPYWLMSGDELRSFIIGKTENEATSQNNILYKALKHSRMVTAGIVQALPSDPLGESNEVYVAGKGVADVAAFDRDRPIRFDLDEFAKHIDCVQGRKTGKNESLATSNRTSHDSILDKLNVLRTDPRLNFLMDGGTDDLSLAAVIDQFTGTPNERTLKIIDISGLPNEVAGPMAALIGRLLFNYKVWQSRVEREKDPLLLVCEEAHRYVPNFGDAQYKEAQEAIRRIAKEGRKYGIGLMLVSQRPSDVESTVLSQCNSWIIMRLTNANDQEHVSRFLPDSLLGLTRIVSSLSRREAIFVGEAAVLPSRIKITQLAEEKLPGSQDISFVKGWYSSPLSKQEIEAVASKWLKG